MGMVMVWVDLDKPCLWACCACLWVSWLYRVGDTWVILSACAILRIGRPGRIMHDRGGCYVGIVGFVSGLRHMVHRIGRDV